jgi:asparagine synthase (glutamine-hydrolysing)
MFTKPAKSKSSYPTSLLGVFGVEDPGSALSKAGIEPTWSNGCVAFGGAPVWSSESGDVIVSGEAILDNADELRQRLERPQSTDGELLTELYECHGPKAGLHALGMYAVAIWDKHRSKLILLRDGVGARTIYFARVGGGIRFSTRLRTLRQVPGISCDLSLPALRNYLSCAFVPGEQTLWRDIQEVRPGTVVELPEGRVVSYWEPVETVWDEASEQSIDVHATRLRGFLEEAVQVCLPKSGPVGVFLSGGLDSSVVTAIAAKQAAGPLHTFAIHFGREFPNELEFSSLVAEHYKTRHHIIELPARVIRDTMLETMAALDDPIGDPLTTPNLILGRAAARETGVILNGEGGDPCFGGPKNLPMLLHELYSGEPREAAYFRSFQKCYDDLPGLLTPDVHSALGKHPPQESLIEHFLSNEPTSSYLHQLMLINVRLKGADHILTKVNNLSAANGIVARSPLFDRRIVEAAFAIPPEYKQSGALEKAVLKRAAADLLPEAILNRPKSGMLVPVQGWFKKDLRRYAKSMMLGKDARIRPYLNQSTVAEWLNYEGCLWPRHGVKLWMALTLEVWLRANGV